LYRGLAADYELWRCFVGPEDRTPFARLVDSLEGWLRPRLDAGRRVVLVGESFGGLLALAVAQLRGPAAARRWAYVAPSAAELAQGSEEQLQRAASVKKEMGDRLISVEDAGKYAAEGAMMLDVRKPIEIVAGSENKTAAVAGTAFVAITEPVDDWISEGRPTPAIKLAAEFGRKVLVICTDGSKSALAWEFLREHGVEAYFIDGGVEAWEKAGLATKVMKFYKYDLQPRRQTGRR